MQTPDKNSESSIYDGPSKSQLKREAESQQAIGKKLVELPKEKLAKLDLPEALLDAVAEAKRITANGAIRRQMQYIGRLMRDIDVAPIVDQARALGRQAQRGERAFSCAGALARASVERCASCFRLSGAISARR